MFILYCCAIIRFSSVSGVRCAVVRVVWIRRDNYQGALARARAEGRRMIYISFRATNLELDLAG